MCEAKLEYTFATMPFYFTGAGTRSELQSLPLISTAALARRFKVTVMPKPFQRLWRGLANR